MPGSLRAPPLWPRADHWMDGLAAALEACIIRFHSHKMLRSLSGSTLIAPHYISGAQLEACTRAPELIALCCGRL